MPIKGKARKREGVGSELENAEGPMTIAAAKANVCHPEEKEIPVCRGAGGFGPHLQTTYTNTYCTSTHIHTHTECMCTYTNARLALAGHWGLIEDPARAPL